MTSPIYADLDIRKQNLQLHWSDGFYAVPDRPDGYSRLIRLEGCQLRPQVICEATGG
jgi:hypothetical protein